VRVISAESNTSENTA